jgi:hypothetical protein
VIGHSPVKPVIRQKQYNTCWNKGLASIDLGMSTHRVFRNISLTPELDGFADSCLATGDYGNAAR